jgi:hypothetical protein
MAGAVVGGWLIKGFVVAMPITRVVVDMFNIVQEASVAQEVF